MYCHLSNQSPSQGLLHCFQSFSAINNLVCLEFCTRVNINLLGKFLDVELLGQRAYAFGFLIDIAKGGTNLSSYKPYIWECLTHFPTVCKQIIQSFPVWVFKSGLLVCISLSTGEIACGSQHSPQKCHSAEELYEQSLYLVPFPLLGLFQRSKLLWAPLPRRK